VPWRRWLLIVSLIVALALGARTWFGRRAEPEPVPEPPDSTAVSVRSATLWFASPEGGGLAAEPRELPEQSELHARVATLVAALEQGPRLEGRRTLPAGTTLLHAYVDGDGILTLDLSRAFRQGFRGGAREEELVLGSLVRTITGNVPEAKRVRIVCAGETLSSLGGHFPLDQPLDPEDWP